MDPAADPAATCVAANSKGVMKTVDGDAMADGGSGLAPLLRGDLAARGTRLMHCPACHAPLARRARFCSQCGASVAAETPAPGSRQAGGERRYVTVMFCDLAGSTTLAARLDPEDFRSVINSYQETCAAAVERYEGHTAQYRGDGILALFGWPQAHEDDAQRAALAALAIVQDLRQLNVELEAERGVRVLVRIGIHAGSVVVGDSAGDSLERQVLGHPLNVAARLQEAAPLEGIVVSHELVRLLRGRFLTEDLGALAVKGLPDAVPAHRLCGRGEGMDPAQSWRTKLIGRDVELATLHEAWMQVAKGAGRGVLVCGDAGIGKSRLVEALRERIHDDPHVWVRAQGSPYHTHSAFHPVADLLQRHLGVQAGDPPERRLALLGRWLDRIGYADRPDLPLALGGLLGVPGGGRLGERDGVGEGPRREILEVLLRWLASLSAERPAVLLIEDVHWLDPSTLELLARFADRLSAARVLLLLTYRPGADPPWSQAPDVSRLVLQPLHAGDAASLVQAIAGDGALPGRVVRELVARADGVPLFIEELTKGVVEARAAEGVASGSGRRSRQPIPSTLEESLGARLDRLGPARHVAQIASVIGRSFSLDLLAAVAEMDAAALERSLERLLEADLLQRRGVGQARYVFKHALIRDAAYDSLLRAQRHEIHGRVAQALAASPAHAGHEPELIGWHHEQAGTPAAALEWYEAALSNATARSAYAEAVAHGKRALGVLATLPNDRARDERELAVRVTLGPSLIAAHGYGAEEVEANYERAYALCAPGGDGTRQVESIWGLANYYQARGRLDTAKELGDRLVATTGATADRQPQVWAHLQLGATHFWRGEYRASLRHLERAVARYDPAGSWFLPGAPDPYVASQAYRGLVLWTLGHPQAGLVACQDAVARAREANRPFSLGLALCFLGSLFRERREPAAVAAVAAEVIGLAEAHGFPTWLGWGRMLAGWAEGHLGRSAGALAQLEQGLAETGRSGTTLGVPAALLHVAEVHLAAGRLDDATSTAEAGLRFAADTGQHAWDGDLHRLEAEAALAAGRDDEAARAVELALARAQEAEALPYELRAAVLQLRLARRVGDDGPAAARLAAVLRRFDEAADATEHVEAHALLRGLR